MKGLCYWFYRNNDGTGSSLKYCRYGSLCRYTHLTQDEYKQLVEGGENLISCPRCRGTGEQDIKLHGIASANGTCKITCIDCNGSRTITTKAMILNKCSNREWCRCGAFVDTIYYPDNTHPKCKKHCYVCSKCKCISQIG